MYARAYGFSLSGENSICMSPLFLAVATDHDTINITQMKSARTYLSMSQYRKRLSNSHSKFQHRSSYHQTGNAESGLLIQHLGFLLIDICFWLIPRQAQLEYVT